MTGPKRKAPDLQSEILADDDAEKGHAERLRKYSGAKAHSNQVASFIVNHEFTLYKEAEALQSCSALLFFRRIDTSNNPQLFGGLVKYRLIGGCTCKKHLLCAMCALRRSAKTVKEYDPKIMQVLSEKPDLIPVLLTLTVKNGSDLDERTRHLDSAITRMISNRRRAKHGDRHTTSFRIIHGAAGAFEFKRGSRSGLWHPHVHMIALIPGETDLLEFEWNISEEWRNLTKDSFNVNVTAIDMSSKKSRFGAICEVFRYALKFGELEIFDQVHAYKILKGKRLVRAFGSLRGVQVPEDLHDSIEDELKLQPYVDLVYQFSKDKGYFLKEVTDTGDQLTGSARPKTTEGSKNASRFSSKVFLQVKDLDKPWRKRPLDKDYMEEWIAGADVEDTYLPTEVPF